MTLTPRQQQVLRIIVDDYINAPVPVASESVAHKMPTHISSATARNEIAALEEDGYILRPHTSAGAVPSDKAYRAYVESLGDGLEPSRSVKHHIRRNFMSVSMDEEARSRTAVRVLAELVRAVAITTVPISPEARWKHLDIVQLHDFLALLIIVLQSSRLRQQHVPLREPMTQEQLTQISTKLNTRLSGLSTEEVLSRSGEFAGVEQEFVQAAAGFMQQEQQNTLPDHYIDGLRHMFTYPELAEGSCARGLAELLEYQQLVRAVFTNMPQQGVVRVTIGAEHKDDLLRPFTIVFARYGTPSGASGVVGVLGPTRFQYISAISNVRYFASVMGEMVEAV
ncbi:MAG: heat-inducible transcription repressor HrcA [Chloroflexi bacterium]|nr:heat-inducible transcription repressor HrcA [Chloroflexota bacterium]